MTSVTMSRPTSRRPTHSRTAPDTASQIIAAHQGSNPATLMRPLAKNVRQTPYQRLASSGVAPSVFALFALPDRLRPEVPASGDLREPSAVVGRLHGRLAGARSMAATAPVKNSSGGRDPSAGVPRRAPSTTVPRSWQ